MSKRGALHDIDDDDDSLQQQQQQHHYDNEQDSKRSKVDNNQRQLTTYKDNTQALATTVNLRNASLVLTERATRLSSLASPELHLTGHDGAVYSMDFDLTGQHLASASMDQKICK
jgi:WD40 repeat protein